MEFIKELPVRKVLVMHLEKKDLPGVLGGIVFMISWLIISKFQYPLEGIFAGLAFAISWYGFRRYFKK